MQKSRQFAFWELKKQPVPFICQGCKERFLQVDHFERVRKFCSRKCVAQSQRDGTFPLPDHTKNKPETQAKRYANLKLGPKAGAEKIKNYDYIWRLCKECREEFPAYCGPTVTNPAQYCSNLCHQRSWQRHHKAHNLAGS